MGECLIIRSGGGTDTSDATATSSVVLSGFTCYVNDELVTGAMINQGSVSQTLSPGGSYAIPEGYHDGTGSIGVTTLASNTSANASASQILTGYNGWVNGAKVDGSMANRGNVSQTLGANGSYAIPAGWHAGGGKVTQSLATQGAVNVTPGTANKTACAANRWTTGTIVILGSSSLVSSNIRNGVSVFGVTGNYVGWVDSTMDFFSWNSSYSLTVNQIGGEMTLSGKQYSATVYKRSSTSSDPGDAQFMSDYNRALLPQSVFRGVRVAFNCSGNPNGTYLYFDVNLVTGMYNTRLNRWVTRGLYERMLSGGGAMRISVSFGNGDGWVSGSFDQTFKIPVPVAYDYNSNYWYYAPDGASASYNQFTGSPLGIEIVLRRASYLRSVWAKLSGLVVQYVK